MQILYDYPRSSACFRVRIALNLKQLPYEAIPIHLLEDGGEQFYADYQAMNPHCLVPTWQDGNGILTQSLAIIEYLNELYPTPTLLPHEPYQKALVRSFALSIAADIHPLNNLRVLKYLTEELAITDAQKTTWYHHWIAKGLQGLEKQMIAQENQHAFCFSDQPTLADICLIPQLYNAKRFKCDLSNYPNLMRVYHSCQQLPAFQQAWPVEATA